MHFLFFILKQYKKGQAYKIQSKSTSALNLKQHLPFLFSLTPNFLFSLSLKFHLVKTFKKSVGRATFQTNSISCLLWKQDILCLLPATNILRPPPQLWSSTAPLKSRLRPSSTTSVFPNACILPVFPLLSNSSRCFSFPLKKLILSTAKHTIAFTPSGKRNRLYRSSTVSFWPTSHSRCRRIGPVSKPSSAQKIVNPAFLSPWIKVLDIKEKIKQPYCNYRRHESSQGYQPICYTFIYFR